MPTERSDTAYGYWRESSEKFDYFVAGVSGALTAYIGQHIRPIPLGINAGTFELLALVLLVASVVMSFKRIEIQMSIFKGIHARLYAEEARGSMVEAAMKGPGLNVATGDVFAPDQMLEVAEFHRAHAAEMKEILDKLVVRSGRYYTWRNRLLLNGFAVLVFSRILPAYIP